MKLGFCKNENLVQLMKPNRKLLDDPSHGIQTSELNPVSKGLNDVIPANPLQPLLSSTERPNPI